MAKTQNPKSGIELPITTHDSRLTILDVRAGYGKKEVLRGVTLAAGKGELVAIIGPNGAGKSTLLKVIAGFLRPSSGSVLLDGRDISRLAPHERVKAGIGYCMQGGRVFPSLTVSENLALASGGNGPNNDLEQILEVFPKLKDMHGRRAGLLSGGERQALALAMTLVRRPTVLLLDEPSAGLSPGLATAMLDKAKEVGHTWGLAVLMVEQNVRGAVSVADRACALANGEMVLETDRPGEWLAQGKLDALFLGTGRTEPGAAARAAGQPIEGES
jgi:ABC-type branched-subunit amino acid transport system ATPase component